MKSIKDIRENYDLITEKEEADVKKLATLVRSGLFDAKKLPFIKRALEKNPADMTLAERKILIELLEQLMAQVLHSQQVYTKVKSNVAHNEMNEELIDEASKDYLVKMDPRFSKSLSEKDIPSIIILKRKAVRVYPDNQKVGLYYSQALDKYVSIPFETGPSAHLNAGLNEAKTVKDSEEDKKKKKIEVAQRLRKLSLKDVPSTPAGKKVSRAITGQAFKDALSLTQNKSSTERLASLGFGLASLIPGPKNKKTVAPKKVAPTIAKAPEATTAPATKKTDDQPTGDVKFAEPSNKTKTVSYSSQVAPARELTPLEKSSGKSVDSKQLPSKRYNFHPKPAGTGPQPTIPTKMPKLKAAFKKKLDEKKNIVIKEYTKGEAAWDVATALPVVGNVLSAGEAAYKAAKGDLPGAALAAAGAVPVVGNVGKATKVGAKVGSEAFKSIKTKRRQPTVERPKPDAKAGSKPDKPGSRVPDIDITPGGGNDSTPTPPTREEPRKFREVGAFSLKPTVSGPTKFSTNTATKTRDEKLYRKSLQENVINQLNHVKSNSLSEHTLNIGNDSIIINNTIAEKIISVYENLNAGNKKKFDKMINESVDSFKKIVNFSVRQ